MIHLQQNISVNENSVSVREEQLICPSLGGRTYKDCMDSMDTHNYMLCIFILPIYLRIDSFNVQ